jgi:hypothetical protein
VSRVTLDSAKVVGALNRTSLSQRDLADRQAMHAGTGLEQLLTGDRRLPVRYEWSGRPTAHVVLGAPWEVIHADGPSVSIELPPNAVLRSPQRRR